MASTVHAPAPDQLAQPHSSANSQPLMQKRAARPSVNAFDESFAAALQTLNPTVVSQPVTCVDAPKPSATKPARPYAISLVGSRIMLETKASTSLAICVWNEVSHTSEYTRPAIDLLKEVLEVRYPAVGSSEIAERELGLAVTCERVSKSSMRAT
ncbi:hypothetical protein B0A48_07789 [Cryoendolithus antarcticus]|uniref:Uncharacterized protein n=1 Tax=Cryoendolithus antarcticus TaxID=1507870 RepID=A0A1V8T7C4_9PEZI|nr:hypothetical protein B0A48_07789 [Cryoendolithus antarcticus]